MSTSSHWLNLERSAVLVLDDEPGIRGMVKSFLTREGHDVVTAADLSEARVHLGERDILVVLADITLSAGESGLDLLTEVRREHPDLDVMMMTANGDLGSAVESVKQGAYDYLCKPFPLEMLKAAVDRAVERRRLRAKAQMLERLEGRFAADQENMEEFLVSMATVIDAKSRYTSLHSQRVSELSRLLGHALGLPEDRVQLVALGGRLHDIGKIGTPDAILDKPGALTRAEYLEIQRHPAVGDDLVAPIRTMQALRPMIRWHHETLDGTGYPDGLPGDQVPLEAWIVKVADFWEAITSNRPYRDPMPLPVAVKVLREEGGKRIPKDLVETFLEAIQDAPVALPVISA